MRMCPRGFTVVEVLVALTLLGVGVTAWIGTSAAALRLANDADRAVAAAGRARDRAAFVASGGCGGMGAGSAGLERWSVIDMGNDVRLVHAEVAFVAARGQRMAVYELMVSC